ncbi:MAG: HAMP domain-containing protein [Deltaproteobacteria bacterium]|nr:HAMP domain-containing protein [Deltaproteobacteria bacterium]
MVRIEWFNNLFSFRRKLRKSLYYRSIFFLIVGSACLLGAVLAQSLITINGMVERLLQERITLARTTGSYLEQMINDDLNELGSIVADAVEAHDKDRVRSQLSEAYLRTIFNEGVFVLDPAGSWLATVPDREATHLESAVDLKELCRHSRELKQTVVSDLIPISKDHGPVLFFVKPILCSNADLCGFVGGLLHPATTNLLLPLQNVSPMASATFELVDSKGSVIASTRPNTLFYVADHESILKNAITAKREIHGRCHACHVSRTGVSSTVRENQVLAFAPLPTLKLGMAVLQPEGDALAPVIRLKYRLIWLGGAFIIIFLVFAFLSVHGVVSPLVRLTQAVRNIEGTDKPLLLPSFGDDEAGELAHALNRWRAKLVDSLLKRKESQLFLEGVLKAQEEERGRIARELHDTIAQDLAAHRLEIERLAKIKAPEQLLPKIQHLEERVQGILKTVRQILIDLRPSVLDDLGFIPALQWYLERVERDHGLKGSLIVEGGEQNKINHEIEISLFRIFQESLKNIVQHARAEHVMVTVNNFPDMIEMTVEDDGEGFNLKVIEQEGKLEGKSLGILGMKERSNLLGGHFNIESKPGEGTSVSVRIPLTHLPGEQHDHSTGIS